MKKQLEYLKIDILRDYVWPFYHKWFLHKGRIPFVCGHMNPWYILTPRLYDRQVKGAFDNE